MLMIRTKPGFTVDSRKPRRKRLAAVPAKLWHAGVVMRIMPQPDINNDSMSVKVDGEVEAKLTKRAATEKLGHRESLE